MDLVLQIEFGSFIFTSIYLFNQFLYSMEVLYIDHSIAMYLSWIAHYIQLKQHLPRTRVNTIKG